MLYDIICRDEADHCAAHFRTGRDIPRLTVHGALDLSFIGYDVVE